MIKPLYPNVVTREHCEANGISLSLYQSASVGWEIVAASNSREPIRVLREKLSCPTDSFHQKGCYYCKLFTDWDEQHALIKYKHISQLILEL
jgi:hypothetical protein